MRRKTSINGSVYFVKEHFYLIFLILAFIIVYLGPFVYYMRPMGSNDIFVHMYNTQNFATTNSFSEYQNRNDIYIRWNTMNDVPGLLILGGNIP